MFRIYNQLMTNEHRPERDLCLFSVTVFDKNYLFVFRLFIKSDISFSFCELQVFEVGEPI